MKQVSAVKRDRAAAAARGRPRSAAARDRVLRAARALLETRGLGAVTIEAVAAASGVSKPTIYRTWPNAQAVAMAALMQPARGDTAVTTATVNGPALFALRGHLRDVAVTLASRTGRSVTMVLAASDPETELSKAFRHHFILARRDEGRRMLEAAAARGELRAGLDLDVTLDQLYGALFFRVLLGHAPLDEAACDRLLDQVMEGVAAPRTRDAGRTRVRPDIAARDGAVPTPNVEGRAPAAALPRPPVRSSSRRRGRP